jgi:cysteine desulfurase
MPDKSQIYLDYAATTPVEPIVLEAMLPYFTSEFGNSSSIHQFGQHAEAALEQSRESVAKILNCLPGEVIFTSCGSESDNLALRGAALAARQQRNATHILISPVEHHAVSRTAQQLKDMHGFELEVFPVTREGQVDPEEVARRIRPDTAVVSVIYANNEIGTVNAVSEIGAICRSNEIAFHTDAVQAATYLTLDVVSLNVDFMAIGGHKFYGPKGIGVLYARQGVPIIPIQTGGGQEGGRRAGTHNIPLIVGLAKALELSQTARHTQTEQQSTMRDYLIGQVLETIPDSRLTGHPVHRLPNHASFVFEEADGNLLLMLLDVEGFACSSGSACKTGDPEPSDVLIALGFSPSWALGSLRVTLGKPTQSGDIEAFLRVLPKLVGRARQR